MSTPYTVAPVELADHASVIKALWLTSLDSLTDAGAALKLDHMYPRNPAGAALSFTLNEHAGEATVGVICLMPRVWHHDGQSLAVGSLVDFAVHPEHRTLGPALQLMRRGLDAARQRYAFTYGLPNKKSEAVCKRMGMRLGGAAVRHAKVLRTGEHLRRLARQRLPGWAAALLTPVLPLAAVVADVGLWAADAARASGAKQLHWRDTGINDLRNGGANDAALDQIWRHCERPSLFVSERSAPYLHWRLAGSAAAQWQLAIASTADGQAHGYVAWREEEGVAHIGDFLCRRPLQDTRALLSGFCRHARQRGVRAVSVEFLGHAAIAGALTGAGFVARADSVPVYVTTGTMPEVPGTSQWYFTALDSDAD